MSISGMRNLLRCVGAASFVAAIVLSLAKAEYPTKVLWSGRLVYLLFGCTIVTLIAPPIQTFAADHGEKQRRRELEREKSFRELLTGVLVGVVGCTKADWTKTAAQVFLVQRHWSWRGWQWRHPFLVEQQDRVARIKLSFTPPPSGITWTRGKGVIGRCWASRDNIVEDLRVRFGPYMAFDKVQWDALDAEARFGLDFAEFDRTKSWYGIVGAAPILARSGKYLGCVSIDTPQTCPNLVSTDDVKELLRATAVSVEVALAG